MSKWSPAGVQSIWPSSPASKAHRLKPSLVCYAQPPRPPRAPRLLIKEVGLSISDSSSSSHPGRSDQGTGITSSLSPKEIMQLVKTADSSLEVLQIVCHLHSSFDPINTATALHKTAKLMRPCSRQATAQHPGMKILLGLAEAQALSFKGQATANILWALAKMQQRPSVHLLSILTAAVHRNLPAFTSQQLAKSIWSLATIGQAPDQDLLVAIAEQATTALRVAHMVCSIPDVLLIVACCRAHRV